jgi:hypothetical protein
VPSAASTYTLRVPPDISADGSRHAATYLRWVVADGHEVPLVALQRSGIWKDLGFALVYEDAAQPGSVSVLARTVTACFVPTTEPRRILIEGPEALHADFDLDIRRHPRGEFACATLSGGRLVEDSASGLGWPGAATVLLVAIVGWRWRPWQSSGSLAYWATTQVAILHVLVWLRQGIGYNNDAAGYLNGIRAFVVGTVEYYPPGYSMFLAPFWLLPHSWAAFAAVGVQHACMVAALVGLRSLARPFLGEDLATLGFVLTGSVVPTLFLPQMILSENVALCGMTGALWLASRPGSEGALRRDMLAAGLAGWAGLARVVPLAVVALPLLLLHTARLGLRPALRRTVRTLLAATAIVATVAAWNFARSGTFAIANSWGLHLYDRVVTEQELIDRDGPATREFLQRIGQRPLEGVPFWEITPALERQGMTYAQTVSLLGGVALEGIHSAPVAFARYSLVLSLRQYWADPSRELWLSPFDRTPGLETPTPLAWRSTSLLWWNQFRGLYAAMWPVLLWATPLGLLALLLLRQRLVFLALLAVPMLFLLAISQLEQFVERFVLAVLPFVLMLVPAPLAALLNLWERPR